MSELHTSYDEGADVLYVSKGPPVPCWIEQSDDGLLYRLSMETGKASAVTVISFRDYWREERARTLQSLSRFLGFSEAELDERLSAIAKQEPA